MVRTRRRFSALVLLLSCATLLPACSRTLPPNADEKVRELDDHLTIRALRTYADIAFATHDDAVRGAQALNAAIEALLTAPSSERLEQVRRAWLAARVPYVQSEVFRLHDDPIDRVELDVLELLLWGRDDNPSGREQRSCADFAVAAVGDPERVAARRGSSLRSAGQRLESQLREVREAWRASDAPSYRDQFLAPPPAHGLRLALRGMAKLSGPAGEPYEAKSPGNEPSCFRDRAQADVLGGALGAENVCLGRYQRSDGSRVSGPGICAALAHAVPGLARALTAQISESVRHARAIPAPFDKASLGDDRSPGRQAAKRAIASLRAQAATSERVLHTLSLEKPVRLSLAR